MARNRVIPNLLYGTLGLAAAGAATYFAVRTLRRRRAHGEDSMLSLRRATRNVGRAAKDAAQKVGTDVSRGVSDTGDALADVGREFESDASTSFNRI